MKFKLAGIAEGAKSTTVEILYEVQTSSRWTYHIRSTTVEILYEVQT